MITWKTRANLLSIFKQVMQQHRRMAAKRSTGQQWKGLIRQQQFLPLILLFFLTQVMNCRMSADLPTVPALFVNASLMSVRGIAFVTKLRSKLYCATHPDTV